MNITKKLTVLFAAATLFLMSCSSGKNTPVAPRKDFKGEWTITSARLEGAEGKINITAFDDAALRCFEGSEWVLPNNGYGSYTIAGGADCPGGTRKIIWSQRVSGGVTLFNFKKIDGVKKSDSKHVEEGYSLEVTSFSDNAFVARSPVLFEGKTVYVVYNFARK